MSNYDRRQQQRRALLTVEVDETLKKVCQRIAERNGETLARVVRRALLAYAQEHEKIEVLSSRHRSLDRIKVKSKPEATPREEEAKALHQWSRRHGQKEMKLAK